MTSHLSYDIERIKQDHDCRSLVEDILGAPVNRSGRAWQWNCPFHEDHHTPSFTAYPDGYKCFGCDAHGDQIDLVMALEQIGFVEAVEYLTGHAPMAGPASSQPVRKHQALQRALWQEPWWQRGARKIIADGVQRLPGSPGADYLANRGIIATSCTAFGLGYVPSVQITEKHGGEWTVVENLGSAIVIPWQANGVIKAVQYRLIEHPTRRFHQKYGSDRTLYGIDRLADPPVLFMVEGELNAVSIWQAAGDLVDVVSFGPEGNIEKAAPYMRAVARKYQHVVVWADKPEKALFAKQAVGRESMPLQSPAGLDANDLLQRGQLAEFVTKVMDKIGAATSIPSSRPNEAVTVIYPADAHCATVHSKWQRLDDGRIEASYTPAELLWAKVATGYEPTAEELAHMAEL